MTTHAPESDDTDHPVIEIHDLSEERVDEILAHQQADPDDFAALWESKIVKLVKVPPDTLLNHPENWRIHTRIQQDALTEIMNRIGIIAPIIVNEVTGFIVDGHLRVSLAQRRRLPLIDVIYVHLSQEEERLALMTFDPIAALAVRDEEQYTELYDQLAAEDRALIDMLEHLESQDDSGSDSSATAPTPSTEAARATLADRFGVPPFSVLDARQGYWSDRKKAWLKLGIQSELGRGPNLQNLSGESELYRRDRKAYAARLDHDGAEADAPPDSDGEDAHSPQGARAARSYGRTFGQDLMKGEHTIGNGKGISGSNRLAAGGGGLSARMAEGEGTDREARRREKAITPGGGGGPNSAWMKTSGKQAPRDTSGVLFTSDSGRDPSYYKQKREKERELGRPLTTEEFQRDHYINQQTGEGLSQTGTSVFDPVLTELAYRWFCAEGGQILDPFAGGSVRGIVAGYLGRHYTGIDLRPEQVAANRSQIESILRPDDPTPIWHCGDSRTLPDLVGPDFEADLIFSCPPYADLEVYSDDPRDISNMSYADFHTIYREIIAHAVARLRPDRFACFVVGDVRDKDGHYHNFVSHTIQAFEDAGARLYNEAIFVTPIGSLAVRVGRQFEKARKLGKSHQNVLIFIKGDWRKATEWVGPVEFGDIEDDTEVDEETGAEVPTGTYDDSAADPTVADPIPSAIQSAGAWHAAPVVPEGRYGEEL